MVLAIWLLASCAATREVEVPLKPAPMDGRLSREDLESFSRALDGVTPERVWASIVLRPLPAEGFSLTAAYSLEGRERAEAERARIVAFLEHIARLAA